MKKVGLYFGTFNPIHVGHLIIANHMADYTELDEVWLIVTPQNPFKEKSSLLADYHRLALVRNALEDNPKVKPSDIEFNLPKPSYTIHTLLALEEKYPETAKYFDKHQPDLTFELVIVIAVLLFLMIRGGF